MAARLPIAALLLLACSPQGGPGPDRSPPVPSDWRLIAPEVRSLVERAAEECRRRPGDAGALAALGRIYQANEAPVLAALSYERALALAPDDARTRYFLGIIGEETGDTAQAVRQLARARDLEPAQPWIRHHLASVLLDAGRAQDALAEAREAVRLDPAEPAFRVLLARVHRQAGSLGEALAAVEGALTRAPDHPGAHQVAALVLDALGRPAEALPHLAKGRVYRADVVRDPWFGEVQGLVATVSGILSQAEYRLEAGKPDGAVRMLEPLARAHPDRPDVHRALGRALAVAGRLARARDAYARAVALLSSDASQHADLASILLDLGDLDGAEREARAALAIDAESTTATVVFGAVRLRKGDPAGALAAVDPLATARTDVPLAFVVRGDAWMALGRAPLAVAAYEAALRAKPDLAYAREKLAEARAASRGAESR